MKRPRKFLLVTLLGGIILGLAILGATLTTDSAMTAQTASTFPRRAVAPLLAADSAAGGPPATATASATGTALTGASCGVERWAVKTLSDADYGQVSFTPVSATVHGLRLLIKPASYPANSRVSDVERTTYIVPVVLVSMKLEEDRDIHLVVADPATSETMIVEFPDVACSGAISSAKKAEMEAARSALVAACGNAPTSSFKSLAGTATLTGVGFFDVIHGQTGVAPNGIELHPVLSFSGSCGAGATTPTATTSTAAATQTTTPQATPTTSNGGYSLPACYVAGTNSCNCANFTTRSWAQWFHDTYDPGDINRLDSDHDGLVCESLPG